VSGWTLAYEGWEPANEGLREALCTLGNGYFATRGAGEEAEDDGTSYPGTYLAGGYDRLVSEVGGRAIENEDLVNFPNWLCLRARVAGGEWLSPRTAEVLELRQELELRRGVLRRRVRLRDALGRRTLLESRRLVHLRDTHVAAIELTVVPENWSGRLELLSALDGRVTNAGVARYRELDGRHLVPLGGEAVDGETVALEVGTRQSRLRVALAARTRLSGEGTSFASPPRTVQEPLFVGLERTVEVAAGRPLTVEKVVALHTSRDQAVSECALASREAVAEAGGFVSLAGSHELAWEHLWRRFEVRLDGEEPAGSSAVLVLRLHVFHLLQTTYRAADLDVGVPARGLHGEAYRGHVFWDELFIFPFLNLRMPELTRALLRYRYRRLGAARRAARAEGLRGACYPWQSGSDGREESPAFHLNPRSGRWSPDHSRLQRHVNAAVAFNVWQYYQATRDEQFLSSYGAEMLLEIARLFASLATWNEDERRFEIRGVVGPDEFHEAYPWASGAGLDNNTYTNVMAVYCLCRAQDVLRLLPEHRSRELRETLGLLDGEIERWEEISRRMRLCLDEDGVLRQFEGWERLEELDWEAYRRRYGDIHRLDRILEAEGDSTNRYKLAKQPDVLMLFYLLSAEELAAIFERLGYPYDRDTIPRNVAYYSARTAHGSTLSRVVHSWVLARSDRPRSWALFCEALESDVRDIQGGTTKEGIHLGAMAGTVDLVQRAYTGLEVRGDVLRLAPCLPDPLRHLHLHLSYRGQALELEVTSERVRVRALPSGAAPIELAVRDRIVRLAAGEEREIAAD
jgi:alpha,alpha-trehalase